MPIIKPPSAWPTLDAGDFINQGQIAWWFGGEGSGTRLRNIARPGVLDATMQAGQSWSSDNYGRLPFGNGTATSYSDMGTTPPSLTTSAPFTIAWLESLTTTPGAGLYSIFTFLPPGSAQRFIAYRTDSSAAYAPITVGIGGATPAATWQVAGKVPPSLASSVGRTRLWILSANLMTNNTSFNLVVDGVDYGKSIGGVGNNIPNTLTANQNYLGWGGSSGSNYPGGISNVRMWNRLLSFQEALRLWEDPFVGAAHRRVLKPSAVSALYNRMFIAM